jgi:cytochrome b561
MKPDGKPDSGEVHETYSTGARHFHWWTVALIAIQLPLGIFMVNYGARTNFASPTGQMYDTHKLIGMLILLFVIARLAYRFVNGAPGDEPTLEPWQRIVSHVTHWAIYALLLIVPLLGWLATSAYGPFRPFGIPLPGLLAENQDLATRLYGIHKGAAILLVLLVGAHVGAALFHYVIRKDGVLNRMWPGLPRRDGK